MLKRISFFCFAVLAFIHSSFSQSIGSIPLYSQTELGTNYPIMSNHFGVGFENLNCQAADDFIVDDDWIIDKVVVLGMHENDFTYETGFNIYIYSSINMMPEDLVYFGSNQPFTQNISTGNPIKFTITLETPVTLKPGIYWLSVQAQMNWSINSWEFWYWKQVSGPYNNVALYQNPGGFWPQGCMSWNTIPSCWGKWGSTQLDLYFELYGNSITPVELTSFTANNNNNTIDLNWITSSETNNRGFEVQRSKDEDFESIGFVEGHGTTTESKSYSYIDREVVTGKYKYRLKQIDHDGTFEYSNVIEVDATTPSNFSLEQNYPNPFNPTTKINFNLAVESIVSFKVFDILGQEVMSVPNKNYSSGSHTMSLDGSSLNSGVYFYRIDAAGVNGKEFSSVKKMILAR